MRFMRNYAKMYLAQWKAGEKTKASWLEMEKDIVQVRGQRFLDVVKEEIKIIMGKK